MTTARTVQVTTPSEREIAITRVLDAPRHLVFDTLTKPDLVKRWLTGPPGWSMTVCEIDLKVGGAFRYVWRNSNGTEIGMGGVYLELSPPGRIVHTELFDADWTGGETRVTTLFAEQDRQTRLTITVRYASTEARDGALRTAMTEGMEASFQNLADLLRERVAHNS